VTEDTVDGGLLFVTFETDLSIPLRFGVVSEIPSCRTRIGVL
ncbi:14851_t:CDS:1, partial [Racocetra fulgida]